MPDNGIIIGPASVFVPDHGGFTLVGNADGSQIGTGYSRFIQSTADGRQGIVPDLHGIMFHPSGFGENLTVLFLIHPHNPALAVKDDKTTARGSLVYCPYVFGHLVLPVLFEKAFTAA